VIPDFLRDVPLIGILRGVARETAGAAAAAVVRGGITTLEVTLNNEDPLALIAELARDLPGVTIGAGTVMSIRDAESALAAGARFIVSPHIDEPLVGFCAAAGIPVFPGAMTPTEVWRAHAAGATMVKLFPASELGPAYVRALRGPLPQIDLLVTGGIDAGNLRAFLDVGARGAAVGGRLFPRHLPDSDTSEVEREAGRLVRAYRSRA